MSAPEPPSDEPSADGSDEPQGGPVAGGPPPDDGDGSLLDAVPQPPIEPGRPDPENALFVVLGVLAALAVVVRLAMLFG